MANVAGIQKRITNHSARRIMIQTLKNNNINPLDICQLSGQKNIKSLDEYSAMSINQQLHVGNIISNHGNNNNIAASSKPHSDITNRHNPFHSYWEQTVCLPTARL